MTEISAADLIGQTIKIYALLTPTAVLSAFISLTRGQPRLTHIIIACKASLAIFIIGELLYLFGPKLFAFFGFTLDAFRIGVGLLLFLTAIDLMNDKYATPRARPGVDISVVPLAIPMGMGPSSIGTVIVMGAAARDGGDLLVGSACIFLASLGMALLLCLSDAVDRILGKTGIVIMAKLTALLLSATAAQVIFTGIKAFIKHP